MIKRLAFVCWLAGVLLVGYFSVRYISYVWEGRSCEIVYKEESERWAEAAKLAELEEQEYDRLENKLERKEQGSLDEQEMIGKHRFKIASVKPLFNIDISKIKHRNGLDQDLERCNNRPQSVEDGKIDTRIFAGIGFLLLVVCYVLSGELFFPFWKLQFKYFKFVELLKKIIKK